MRKFLYRNADLTIELYSETDHGPRSQWEGVAELEESDEIALQIDSSISLERDIEEHLVRTSMRLSLV